MGVIGQRGYILFFCHTNLHFYLKRPYEYVWPILNSIFIVSYFFDIIISLSYTYYTVNASKSELFPITNNLSAAESTVDGFGGTSNSSPRLIPTALRL